MKAEVTGVTGRGITLVVDGEEFELSYERYPWFRYGSEADVRAVERWSTDHLHWDRLDVDLHVDALRNPDRYPRRSQLMPDLPLRVADSGQD